MVFATLPPFFSTVVRCIYEWALSGRSFAVPGQFWKAAILPNPAFDADLQIRLDHAGFSDSAFVVICTICASSNSHTRNCDAIVRRRQRKQEGSRQPEFRRLD